MKSISFSFPAQCGIDPEQFSVDTAGHAAIETQPKEFGGSGATVYNHT